MGKRPRLSYLTQFAYTHRPHDDDNKAALDETKRSNGADARRPKKAASMWAALVVVGVDDDQADGDS